MKLLKVSCMVTGDDYEKIKNDTPMSQKKVSTLSITILIPTVMWFLTAYLMTTEIMQLHFIHGWGAGTVAAFIVFQLERSIVMATGNWILAIFRIVLGVFMAFLGSIVMDQILFKDDINHQLTTNRSTHVQSELNKLKKQHEKELATQKQNVNSKYQFWLHCQDLVHQEMSGKGLTGKLGDGHVTQRLIANEKEAKSEYEKAHAQLAQLLDIQKADLTQKAEESKNAYSNKSLLLRIKAMFDLIKIDQGMKLVYWFVTGFLFMLEFMVIIIKMTHSESNYEYKIAMIDQIGKDRADSIAGRNTSSNKDYDNATARKIPSWSIAVLVGVCISVTILLII